MISDINAEKGTDNDVPYNELLELSHMTPLDDGIRKVCWNRCWASLQCVLLQAHQNQLEIYKMNFKCTAHLIRTKNSIWFGLVHARMNVCNCAFVYALHLHVPHFHGYIVTISFHCSWISTMLMFSLTFFGSVRFVSFHFIWLQSWMAWTVCCHHMRALQSASVAAAYTLK